MAYALSMIPIPKLYRLFEVAGTVGFVHSSFNGLYRGWEVCHSRLLDGGEVAAVGNVRCKDDQQVRHIALDSLLTRMM